MRSTFLLLFVLVIISSCTTFYFPNARNLPMFSSKGEFQASASFIGGYNFESAYAASNKIGVSVNGMYSNFKTSNPGSRDEHFLGETAIGYYKNTENYYFDTWIGYGLGRADSGDSATILNPTHFIKGNYQRFFIQPSLGFRDGNFYSGFATRLSMLNLSDMKGVESGKAITYDSTPAFFIEPTAIGKYFFGKFYVTSQFGFTFQIGSLNNEVTYIPFHFSFGIGLRLGSK
jgi:hypothetical protein